MLGSNPNPKPPLPTENHKLQPFSHFNGLGLSKVNNKPLHKRANILIWKEYFLIDSQYT
jgi:hypothetical protein